MADNHNIMYVVRRNGLPDVTVTPEVYYNDFRKRIQSMIGVVEQLCYMFENGKDKELWSEFTQNRFQTFRKKMLDIADEVAEMGDNILIEDIIDTKNIDKSRETDNVIMSLFRNKQKG